MKLTVPQAIIAAALITLGTLAIALSSGPSTAPEMNDTASAANAAAPTSIACTGGEVIVYTKDESYATNDEGRPIVMQQVTCYRRAGAEWVADQSSAVPISLKERKTIEPYQVCALIPSPAPRSTPQCASAYYAVMPNFQSISDQYLSYLQEPTFNNDGTIAPFNVGTNIPSTISGGLCKRYNAGALVSASDCAKVQTAVQNMALAQQRNMCAGVPNMPQSMCTGNPATMTPSDNPAPKGGTQTASQSISLPSSIYGLITHNITLLPPAAPSLAPVTTGEIPGSYGASSVGNNGRGIFAIPAFQVVVGATWHF